MDNEKNPMIFFDDKSRITVKDEENIDPAPEISISPDVEELTKLLVEKLLIDKKQSDFLNGIEECIKALFDEETRIQYHIIARELYEIELENRDIIFANIQYLSGEFKKSKIDDNYCDVSGNKLFSYKFWLKIYDHIHLSIIQKKTMDDITEAYVNALVNQEEEMKNSVSRERERVDNELENLSKVSTELDTKFKRINFDVISVLGIFTGLSFVMFGGLTMVSNITLESNYNTLIQFLLIGMLMIDTVIVLLQYIKSISDPEVNVKDLIYEKNADTKGSPTYFVYTNMIVFYYLFVILSVEYRFEIKLAIEEITGLNLSGLPVFLRTIISVVVVVFPILACLLHLYNKKPKAKL